MKHGIQNPLLSLLIRWSNIGIFIHFTVGNVYQIRLVNGVEQVICLASGNYTKQAVAGNDLYLISGGAITRVNLTTLESELVFSANTPIKEVEASEGVMFFKSSAFIYRYTASTKEVELVCDVGNVAGWYPVTNQTICVLRLYVY